MIVPLRLQADTFGTDRAPAPSLTVISDAHNQTLIRLPFPLAKLKAYESSRPPKTFQLCCEAKQPIMLSDPGATVE